MKEEILKFVKEQYCFGSDSGEKRKYYSSKSDILRHTKLTPSEVEKGLHDLALAGDMTVEVVGGGHLLSFNPNLFKNIKGDRD